MRDLISSRLNRKSPTLLQSGADRVLDHLSMYLREETPAQSGQEWQLLLANSAVSNLTALQYVPQPFAVGNGFEFTGWEALEIAGAVSIITYSDERPANRSGAIRFQFRSGEQQFEVLVAAAWTFDSDMYSNLMCVARVPVAYTTEWLAFEKECMRILQSAVPHRNEIYIVGGVDKTFDTTVAWDDIYLPGDLKSDIMKDIDAFFQKGVAIYSRLNIKPFRKLLLAGVPGTGKTMLCSAIAGWGKTHGYFVVYVSGSNQFGARFWKIHEALEMAASSDSPTIVIVEELDSYLDEENKAQMLNVLDGSESPINKHGTLLIATTNHPERIDDRVLKRPGRLDRIFIIPEMDNQETVLLMLQKYMGDQWREEHAEVVPDLLGKPGAFIREVALHALTMAAYSGQDEVDVDLLRESLQTLVAQIEAKDDFLVANKRSEMGLMATQLRRNKRNSFRIDL
jgi:hypothetical protein